MPLEQIKQHLRIRDSQAEELLFNLKYSKQLAYNELLSKNICILRDMWFDITLLISLIKEEKNQKKKEKFENNLEELQEFYSTSSAYDPNLTYSPLYQKLQNGCKRKSSKAS